MEATNNMNNKGDNGPVAHQMAFKIKTSTFHLGQNLIFFKKVNLTIVYAKYWSLIAVSQENVFESHII